MSPRRLVVLGTSLLTGCSSEPPPAAEHAGHAQHAEHASHAGHHHGSANHGFKDAAAWSKEFDDPARDRWQKPDEVVKHVALDPGMTVADVGAGTGYFEGRLSKAVGAEGKVLALDVEPDMVRFMSERFAREGITNAEARSCPYDGTGLQPGAVDRVLIVDTWHHIQGREAYAKHLYEVLRPQGMVVIVDFTQETDKGPPREHRVTAEQVVAELEAGGLEASIAGETLPDQYIVHAVRVR